MKTVRIGSDQADSR